MKKKFSYKFYSNTGETWEAMYQAILGAQESILWEIFIFVDDEAGQRFVDLFCQKAISGLQIVIVIDAIGSSDISRKAIEQLQSSGVKIIKHNDPMKFSWSPREWWHRIWYRSHRKVLIVDGQVAFLGGVNVSKYMEEWDDLHVEMTGRIVRQLAHKIAKDYVRSGGPKADVQKWLHPKREYFERLREKISLVLNHPVFFGQTSTIKELYKKSLLLAKESFNLVTPYYAPDKDFLKLIAEAKKRGVKVNILVPLRPDVWILRVLAQAFYDASIRAGATFYVLPRMNHAKAVQVDKKLGIVGSANFTPRSFFSNRESGVVFEEEKMVEELNSIFEKWKSDATVLDENSYQKTGIWKRIKIWLAEIVKDYV